MNSNRKQAFLFFLFFTISIGLLNSQSAHLDSLREVYLQQLDTTVDLSAKSKIYFQLSDTYTFESDSLQEFFLKKSYQSALKDKNEIREMLAATRLSSLKRWQGSFDSALFYLSRAETIVNMQSDGLRKTKALTGMMSNYGRIFQDLGDYEKAIQYLFRAISYADEENLSYNEAMAMMNIGGNYLAMDDDQEAEEYFRSALLYADTTENLQLRSWNYQNIGSVYSKRGLLDTTLNYYRKALNISKDDQASSYREVLILISEVFVEKASYDSAFVYLDEAKLYYDDTNTTFQIKYHLLLSKISYSRNNLITAKRQAEQAYSLAQKDEKAQMEVLRHQVEIFRREGEYKEALSKKDELTALENKFLNEEKIKAVKNLEVKYETEKIKSEKVVAENRTRLALAESETNKLLFLGVTIVAILIVISAIFYISRQKQAKQAEMLALKFKESQKQLALERQYQDSELKALKAQMNPHFIFNVLNSIQEYIVLNNKEQASDYLSMFSHLIRSYLDQSGKKTISLQEEAETLNRYLQLEALRFEEDFSMQINVSDTLDQDIIRIPPMIIQPYVENAIKHGLFNKQGVKKLVVVMEESGEKMLRCSIQDNGIGRKAAAKIKASKPNMHESFALGATQSRIELYNQQAKSKISIDVVDLFDKENNAIGTKVNLLIPIQS